MGKGDVKTKKGKVIKSNSERPKTKKKKMTNSGANAV